MTFWSNLIGYQAVWLAAVMDAGHGKTWPGVVAAVLFVTWQWLASTWRGTDTRLLVAALAWGVLVDGVLAHRNWIRCATPDPALPPHGAPAWILALWAAFSMTLTRSLGYLGDRSGWAVVFGAIGAPLAYLGAQRGWHAVIFEAPVWRAVVWLSCTWAAAMLVLIRLARRRTRAPAVISGGEVHP